MVGLGDLPGGVFHSEAFTASTDGSVIAGEASIDGGQIAMVWSQQWGMRDLKELLIEQGLAQAVSGWNLLSVIDVSGDGQTFIGDGINPDGFYEGWIATVPEPTTFVLGWFGATLVLGAVLRRRVWRIQK